MLYLNIINTFLKNNAPYTKFSKELENGFEILVGQAVFKLWIKTDKKLFESIAQEPLDLSKFWCYFWVSWTIYYKMQKGADDFEIEYKTC